MTTSDLLIEIGTEELPPTALLTLSNAFTKNICDALDDAELAYTNVHAYASPRRLALWIEALETKQADKEVEKRGPALKAAYDADGNPTKAVQGFARSCGVEVSDLQQMETDKGTWLMYRAQQTGQETQRLLAEIIKTALDKLPIAKRMRWGALDAQFVRPVQWVMVLFNSSVVDCNILSVQSADKTYGHRFHAPAAIKISQPADYASLLKEKGRVIADFNQRKEMIREQIKAIAKQFKAVAVIDEDLLNEVTAMVEWPVAVKGNFEERFLAVPQEALIYTMKLNQKYFHLEDANGRLMPHFITISNIESKDPIQVSEGNERVIRPRFADAEFFWNQDRKNKLDSQLPRLKTVVFQKQLGSLFDKTQRVKKLAGWLARQLGVDKNLAQRAAELCKCDLMTDMVGELPSLQGVMGRYYALHDGEDAQVADALESYYKPRFAGDSLPDSAVSQIVALADRVDTLVGIFAIGQIPSGVKDPFALRRASLGVLRILIEAKLDIDLKALLMQAASSYESNLQADNAVQPVLEYCLDRLSGYYQDKDIHNGILQSVLATNPTRPVDFDKRIQAVKAFMAIPAAESLAAANKRSGNILKKVKGSLPSEIDEKLLSNETEKVFFQTLSNLKDQTNESVEAGAYEAALQQLAALREPVDAFFDNVMVMDEDEAIRNNRIALLNNLHTMFMQIADLSKI